MSGTHECAHTRNSTIKCKSNRDTNIHSFSHIHGFAAVPTCTLSLFVVHTSEPNDHQEMCTTYTRGDTFMHTLTLLLNARAFYSISNSLSVRALALLSLHSLSRSLPPCCIVYKSLYVGWNTLQTRGELNRVESSRVGPFRVCLLCSPSLCLPNMSKNSFFNSVYG